MYINEKKITGIQKIKKKEINQINIIFFNNIYKRKRKKKKCSY